MQLLKDETGSWSSARCSFWLALLSTLVLVTWDGASTRFSVPEPGYTVLGAILTITGVWAVGPRIAQYLGPQLGAIVSAIGQTKRSKEPDLYHDDER
jgi:hypothetical protein